MAHNVEPMDVDCMDSEFDNKENTYLYSNVLPCTEKGYEELDVSELNMKLRYSVTPAASPMSKSYTAYTDKNIDTDEINENNLTRSLNSMMTKNEVLKSLKTPLQSLPTEFDSNRNSAVLRQIDTTVTDTDNNTMIINTEIDENLSLPSSSSSTIHTPEATTPTNNMINEEGSPIMRGLKSVLNMFRSSTSPIPPADGTSHVISHEVLTSPSTSEQAPLLAIASTPIAAHRSKEGSSKRNSPLKESITFNDDLEKEIQWKDETTIIFSHEKVPLHKLFNQNTKSAQKEVASNDLVTEIVTENFDKMDTTVEYMDISYNDLIVQDKTLTETPIQSKTETHNESDGEFVDCETTFTNNDTQDILSSVKDPLLETEVPKLDITHDTQTNMNILIPPKTIEIKEESNTTISILQELDNLIDVKPDKQFPSFQREADIINDIDKTIEDDKYLDVTQEVTISQTVPDNLKLQTATQILSTVEKFHSENPKADNQVIEINNVTSDLNKINSETCEEYIREMSPKLTDVEKTNADHRTLDLTAVTTDGTVSSSVPIELAQQNVDKTPSKSDKENSEIIESNKNIKHTISTNESPEEISDSPCEILIKETEKPADVLLPDENVNKIAPVDIDSTNESPEEISDSPCEILIKETEKPADVPLPDENVNKIAPVDIDKEIKPNDKESEVINTGAEPNDKQIELIDIEQTFKELPQNIVAEVIPDLIDTTKIDTPSNVIETTITTEINSANTSIVGVDNLPRNEYEIPTIENKDYNITQSDNIINEIVDNKTQENIELEVEAKITLDHVNITVEQLQNESSNIELMKVSENVNEVNVLPDLVNETIPILTDNIEIVINNGKIARLENEIAKETTKTEPDVIENPMTDKKSSEIKPVSVECNTAMVEEKVLQSAIDSLELCNTTTVINKENSVIPKNMIDCCVINESMITHNNLVNSTVSVDNHDTSLEKVYDPIVTINAEACKSSNNDVEIIVSENNSPYVSIMVGIETETKSIEDNFKEVENTLKTDVPSSPPIVSKGYNFNFDDIDDPFATKTKIRKSPSPDTPEKVMDLAKKIDIPKPVPRRRSQPPERKKQVYNKKKINTTIDATTKATNKDKDVKLPKKIIAPFEIREQNPEEITTLPDQQFEEKTKESDEQILDHKPYVDTSPIALSQVKANSSSEQSAYYSAAASSTESMCRSKNVFNLPEIDDINFNPFATKSKMRESPPPNLDNNPFSTRNKMKSTPDSSMTLLNTEKQSDTGDKMDVELMEKDALANTSLATTSSKATDDMNLTHEVHTEDEDTEEGPFFEADDITDKTALGNDNNMMYFDSPQNEDNGDPGELFIDAEAFEFLLNQNKSNVVADSGKESLFLKFDPLFAKRMSTGVVSALNNLPKRQSTPTKTRTSPKHEISIAGPSNLNATFESEMNASQESNDDHNVTVSKPMMVVTPAVNPAVTPRSKSTTPNTSNRRSITFTSPAIAVIDRLLSISAYNSPAGQNTITAQPNRGQNEADIALVQLRELLAEKEIQVSTLRSESKELKNRLALMESQVRTLETDGQERLKKINDLNNQLAEKTKINKSMAAVVEEYERTIASLIAETEQDKKRHAEERMKLISERDEQTAHLASMEVSFSDLHSKYEKSKQVIFNCKANEETYKKSIKEFEESLAKMQNNYEMLKQHATSKLNHANQELEKMNRAHEAEVLKLNAMIKRKELHITSLEETLTQKTKANEELTAICDELINKVG